MGFQPSTKVSTTDGWWAKMWWKCVPDGWGCNMETPSTKLCCCRRDKHDMVFSRTKMCPASGSWTDVHSVQALTTDPRLLLIKQRRKKAKPENKNSLLCHTGEQSTELNNCGSVQHHSVLFHADTTLDYLYTDYLKLFYSFGNLPITSTDRTARLKIAVNNKHTRWLTCLSVAMGDSLSMLSYCRAMSPYRA